MANTCAICGATINVFQSQKLADGNYLCRKVCCKKALKYFDLVQADLIEYKEHAAQVEKGTKIWQRLFVPNMKNKNLKKTLSPIYAYPDIGLMALVETRYKFMNFGKSELACVYRIADLVGYETETETKVVDGKQQKEYFVHYSFANTEGMSHFRVNYSKQSECAAVADYFNKLFGIQKTLGNSINNANRQIDAIKSVVSAVSAAAKSDENADDKARSAFTALDAAIYGDRSELSAKADEALMGLNV